MTEQETANRIADWIGDYSFAHGDDSLQNVVYKIEAALRSGEWKLGLPRNEAGEPIPRHDAHECEWHDDCPRWAFHLYAHPNRSKPRWICSEDKLAILDGWVQVPHD